MTTKTDHPAAYYLVQTDDALFADCEFDRFRSHGPGGQKRNKTDSAVRLRHRPTGVVAIAVESRSQHENRARALQRLRLELALNIRSLVDITNYKPSSSLADRLVIRTQPLDNTSLQMDLSTDEQSETNQDDDRTPGKTSAPYCLRLTRRDAQKPLVYAELLDLICAARGQLSASARLIGISTGNLVRILREEPKVWAEANRIRLEANLPHLKS